jgi:peroxiredoxin Q/BCP
MSNPVSLRQGVDAPEFCLPSSDGNQICLSELKGKWIVLYFYPKDNTSG